MDAAKSKIPAHDDCFTAMRTKHNRTDTVNTTPVASTTPTNAPRMLKPIISVMHLPSPYILNVTNKMTICNILLNRFPQLSDIWRLLSISWFLWDKRVRPFCICFYCICCDTRVDLRRGFHRHGRVTAHVSRHSAHDGEGEGKRGLVTVVHRVNYTIFAALCVGFRGSNGLVVSQLFNFSTGPAQPFNFSTC